MLFGKKNVGMAGWLGIRHRHTDAAITCHERFFQKHERVLSNCRCLLVSTEHLQTPEMIHPAEGVHGKYVGVVGAVLPFNDTQRNLHYNC